MEPKPVEIKKNETDGATPRPSFVTPQPNVIVPKTSNEQKATLQPLDAAPVVAKVVPKMPGPEKEKVRPVGSVVQRTTPTVRHEAIGLGQENPLLDELTSKAILVDDARATSPRFRPRLRTLLMTAPPQWMSWGSESVTTVNKINDENLRLTNTYRQLQTTKIADECQAASCRPPSFTDRITKRDHAEFYKNRLAGIRSQLETILTETATLRRNLAPALNTIAIDTLVVSVATTSLTDPIAQTIAKNQERTLLGSLQLGMNLDASIQNFEATLVQSATTIDRLLLEVIPQWTLSQSSEYRK